MKVPGRIKRNRWRWKRDESKSEDNGSESDSQTEMELPTDSNMDYSVKFYSKMAKETEYNKMPIG